MSFDIFNTRMNSLVIRPTFVQLQFNFDSKSRVQLFFIYLNLVDLMPILPYMLIEIFPFYISSELQRGVSNIFV